MADGLSAESQLSTLQAGEHVYEVLRMKTSQQIEESSYTNLQIRNEGTQPSSSSSSSSSSSITSSSGAEGVGSQTCFKVFASITILFFVFMSMAAIAMAGMTLSSGQETAGTENPRSNALNQAREEFQENGNMSALIDFLENHMNQLQQQVQENAKLSHSIDLLTEQLTELKQDSLFKPSPAVQAQPSWSCYTETANSTLGDNGNYRNRFETPEITTQISGRETVSMSCQYNSMRTYTVVTFMRGSQGRVRCYCDVFNFISSQPARATLASDLQLECVLSVTRCYQT